MTRWTGWNQYAPDSKVHVANMGPTWGLQDPTQTLLSGALLQLCWAWAIPILHTQRNDTDHRFQTPQKLWGFHQTQDRFWPYFTDIKHDYTQEFYRSYSSFISQCPRTGKFRSVCQIQLWTHEVHHMPWPNRLAMVFTVWCGYPSHPWGRISTTGNVSVLKNDIYLNYIYICIYIYICVCVCVSSKISSIQDKDVKHKYIQWCTATTVNSLAPGRFQFNFR